MYVLRWCMLAYAWWMVVPSVQNLVNKSLLLMSEQP